MRDGFFPATARTKVLDSLSEETIKFTWKPIFASASVDQSFGYTYGSAEVPDASGISSNKKFFMYMKIWKRDENGDYKIVLDVIKPTDTLYTPE